MNVIFKYDIDKDVQNFINSTKSVNSKTPTKLFLLFSGESSNSEVIIESDVKHFIEKYIHKNNINILDKVNELQRRWGDIQTESISRLEGIFKIKYPIEEITAYLTTNERCTYNTKENYFFVNLNNPESNRTVLHELFHFYTWYAIQEELDKKGVTALQYNDIKESLTELLNIEFKDLLDGVIDRGYPQHQEMRKRIRELWMVEKDVNKLALQLLSGREILTGLETKGKYLFHGSADGNIETLEPRQSVRVADMNNPTEMVNDGEPAVSATPYSNVAIFRSIINHKNIKLDYSSSFGKIGPDLLFSVSSEKVLEQARDKKGFVYVFDKSDFQPYNRNGNADEQSMEWRSYKEVRPVKVVEVGYGDLPPTDQIKINGS